MNCTLTFHFKKLLNSCQSLLGFPERNYARSAAVADSCQEIQEFDTENTSARYHTGKGKETMLFFVLALLVSSTASANEWRARYLADRATEVSAGWRASQLGYTASWGGGVTAHIPLWKAPIWLHFGMSSTVLNTTVLENQTREVMNEWAVGLSRSAGASLDIKGRHFGATYEFTGNFLPATANVWRAHSPQLHLGFPLDADEWAHRKPRSIFAYVSPWMGVVKVHAETPEGTYDNLALGFGVAFDFLWRTGVKRR
ncbi:hypothetical protein ACFL2M_01355 [Patescibacteria group bacterium]